MRNPARKGLSAAESIQARTSKEILQIYLVRKLIRKDDKPIQFITDKYFGQTYRLRRKDGHALSRSNVRFRVLSTLPIVPEANNG
jgi:hypothetical protein